MHYKAKLHIVLNDRAVKNLYTFLMRFFSFRYAIFENYLYGTGKGGSLQLSEILGILSLV